MKNPTSTALATGVSNEGEKQASTLIRTQGEEFVRLSSCLESVEEIKASLDVLFSLYYGVVKECSSTRFLQLAKTFDQKVFFENPTQVHRSYKLSSIYGRANADCGYV